MKKTYIFDHYKKLTIVEFRGPGINQIVVHFDITVGDFISRK